MNTDTINLTEIEWMLFKPVPGQPGFVTFDRNLTVNQFADEIKTRLPEEIRRRLDYFGPYHYTEQGGIHAQIGDDKPESARNTDLTPHWARGSNEGFFNSVYAITRQGHILLDKKGTTVCNSMTSKDSQSPHNQSKDSQSLHIISLPNVSVQSRHGAT